MISEREYDKNIHFMTTLGRSKLLNICKNIFKYHGIKVEKYEYKISYNEKDQITRIEFNNYNHLYSRIEITGAAIGFRQEADYMEDMIPIKEFDIDIFTETLNFYLNKNGEEN